MIETFRIPRLRNTAAIIAMSGVALGASSCSGESQSEISPSRPSTTITIPESGPIDTLDEFFVEYCQGELTRSERNEAIVLTQVESNKSTVQISKGEILQTPVGVCDIVQQD